MLSITDDIAGFVKPDFLPVPQNFSRGRFETCPYG
jgi:hypothetical protein